MTQNSVGKYFFHTDDGVNNLSSVVRGLVLADAPISMSKLLYRQITSGTEIDALESTLPGGPDLLVGGITVFNFKSQFLTIFRHRPRQILSCFLYN